MKALSLTIQKLWPMYKFFVDKQTDKWTGQKLYFRDLLMRGGGGGRGHKNEVIMMIKGINANYSICFVHFGC